MDKLPFDLVLVVLDCIAENRDPDYIGTCISFCSLASTCKAFHRLTKPYLYRLMGRESFDSIDSSIEFFTAARKNPAVRHHLRHVFFAEHLKVRRADVTFFQTKELLPQAEEVGWVQYKDGEYITQCFLAGYHYSKSSSVNEDGTYPIDTFHAITRDCTDSTLTPLCLPSMRNLTTVTITVFENFCRLSRMINPIRYILQSGQSLRSLRINFAFGAHIREDQLTKFLKFRDALDKIDDSRLSVRSIRSPSGSESISEGAILQFVKDAWLRKVEARLGTEYQSRTASLW